MSSDNNDNDTSLPDSASITTISTTATAPNFPGAGRTVGIALDWLGLHLETLLNKHVAMHLDVGPEAIAREIRHLRRLEEASIVGWPIGSEQSSGGESRRLRALCKRLLKYASSKVQSTRESAEHAIKALSVDDLALYAILTKGLIDALILGLTHDGGRRGEDETLYSAFEDFLASFGSKMSRWTEGSGTSTIWSGLWTKERRNTSGLAASAGRANSRIIARMLMYKLKYLSHVS